MSRLDDTRTRRASIGEEFGCLLCHEDNGILACQVVVNHWIVDVILNLFDWKIGIDGIPFRDLRDEMKRDSVGNSFDPVLEQTGRGDPVS